MLAHPADLEGGDAGHEGVGFDVLGDDGAGGDEGVFAQGDAADNRGVGADGGAFLHQGAAVFFLADDGGAGVMNVSEDHAGAAEDVVLQGDGVVNTDVVLYLAVIADDHVVADEDVLAKGAALADARAGADVDPVPDAGALADLGAGVDDGGGVNGGGHGVGVRLVARLNPLSPGPSPTRGEGRKRWRRLVFQGQGDGAAVAGGEVGGDEQFEGFEALATVGLGLGQAAQAVDDVVIVERVAKAIDAGGFVVGGFDLGVVIAGFGKVPKLDVIDGHPADADAAGLAENGDGAFQVFGVGEHGDAHGAEGAIAPAHVEDAGVFDLDVAGGADHGLDLVHRADEPVEQVDVVAGLVHEGAAVELPGAAPAGLVVVGLGAGPEDVEVDQVDTAEALFLHGALEELEGGVAAVLFDDEEVDAGLIAGLDHVHAVLPAGGHGLFGHDVDAVAGGADGLLRVQAAGGAEGDQVRLDGGQQFRQVAVAGDAGAVGMLLEDRGVGVADGDQLDVLRVLGDSTEVAGGDTSAADYGYTNLPAATDFVKHGRNRQL